MSSLVGKKAQSRAVVPQRHRKGAGDARLDDLANELRDALSTPGVLGKKRKAIWGIVKDVIAVNKRLSGSERVEALVDFEEMLHSLLDILTLLQEPRDIDVESGFVSQFILSRFYIDYLNELHLALLEMTHRQDDFYAHHTFDADDVFEVFKSDNRKDLERDAAMLKQSLEAVSSEYPPLSRLARKVSHMVRDLSAKGLDAKLHSSKAGRKSLKGRLAELASKLAVEMQAESATIRRKKVKLIEPIIHQGTFGTAVAGRWRGIDVVAKSDPSFTSVQDQVEILRVLRVWTNISHRNLVHLWGAYMWDMRLQLVLERCDWSLDDLLDDEEVELTPSQEETIMKGVARGLAHLHSLNILHRNLQPRNVLLLEGAEPGVKLTDFGFIPDSFAEGNIPYAAPETLELPARWSPRSDVYSFAILCWQIKERQPPWYNYTVDEVVDVVDRGERPTFGDNTGWKARMCKLIKQCWAPQPKFRPNMDMVLQKVSEMPRERRSTRVMNTLFRLHGADEDITSNTSSDNKDIHNGVSHRFSLFRSPAASKRINSDSVDEIFQDPGLKEHYKEVFKKATQNKREAKAAKRAKKKKALEQQAVARRLSIIQANKGEPYPSVRRTTSHTDQDDEALAIEVADPDLGHPSGENYHGSTSSRPSEPQRVIIDSPTSIWKVKPARPQSFTSSSGSSVAASQSTSSSRSRTRSSQSSKRSHSVGNDNHRSERSSRTPSVGADRVSRTSGVSSQSEVKSHSTTKSDAKRVVSKRMSISYRKSRQSSNKRISTIIEEGSEDEESESDSTPPATVQESSSCSQNSECSSNSRLESCGREPLSERQVLQEMFEAAEIADKLDAALDNGFSIEAGKKGSHMELKAAGGIPMGKRFEIIKACQAYEPPSGDAESEQGSKRSSKSSYASSKRSSVRSTKSINSHKSAPILPPGNVDTLRAIFTEIGLESKVDAAIASGFTVEQGEQGNTDSLKEAGFAFKERFDIVKACQTYVPSSGDAKPNDDEGGRNRQSSRASSKQSSASGRRSSSSRTSGRSSKSRHEETPENPSVSIPSEREVLQDIFQAAGVPDKLDAALDNGFSIEAGKKGSHMELKAAGGIPMGKRFEIIKACQAYEPPSGDAESEQGSKRSSKSSYASSKVSEKSSTSEQDGEQDDYPPEHKPLHKIFVDLQIEDKFEDALTHGFSMEVGMAGSHVGLEEAGVSMGKRHHLIKACKAYGRNLKGERRSRKKSVIPSEDEIARDDAIVLEIFKKAKVPDKFEDAKIHGFSLAVGRTGSVQELKSAGVLRAERAAIIKLCQEYRDINSRASSDTEEEDENEEEDAVVAEVEDDEAEEDESNNHEETELPIATPDVDSEVLKILKEAGLEKYQANFSEHKFRTLKDCQKLDHTILRSMGVSTYTERAKALRVLRDPQEEPKETSKPIELPLPIEPYPPSPSEVNEQTQIREILKKAGVSDSDCDKLFEKGANTIENCKALSHPELRNIGFPDFSTRDKMLQAFSDLPDQSRPGRRSKIKSFIRNSIARLSRKSKRESQPAPEPLEVLSEEEKSADNDSTTDEDSRLSSSISSGTESTRSIRSEPVVDENSEKGMVLKILRQHELMSAFKALDEANLTSMRKMKKLTHTELRAAGFIRFLERKKIIEAFTPNDSSRKKPNSISNAAEPARERSSTVASRRSTRLFSIMEEDARMDEVTRVLKNIGMDSYAALIISKGYDTVEKAAQLTHTVLRKDICISTYKVRDVIIQAFRDEKAKKNGAA